MVEYEDGHILLKASFEYEIRLDNQNSNSIIIKNFKVLNQ